MPKKFIASSILLVGAWLFIFSFAAHASSANNHKREVISAVKLTQPQNIKEIDLSKEESLLPPAELLKYVNQLEEELKAEEKDSFLADKTDKADKDKVDQIGGLSLTEGMGKKRVKLFTGSKKLSGKANKNDKINLILFRLINSKNNKHTNKKVIVLSDKTYEIGASQLFSAEIELNRVGVNYLLINVENPEKEQEHQLYQIIVEDNKTKDKLENMTLQFMK